MQEEEVTDVKWVSINEIKNMIENNEFAPNIPVYIEIFEKLLNYEY